MKENQRPWWVFAFQLPLFNTVLREESASNQKRFIIEGKPVLRSLHWVTHAPALAVLSMVLLSIIAWNMNIKSQPGAIKLFFVFLMTSVPAIVWLISGLLLGKIISRYLARQVEQNACRIEIVLDTAQAALILTGKEAIPIAQILDFKLITDSGLHYNPDSDSTPLFNLILETERGQIPLLPKDLGNVPLKLQLINRLKTEIKEIEG